MGSRTSVETARKWLHLAPGALAFTLPFIGAGGGLILCAGLVLFNYRVLPSFGGRRLWRPAERADGEAWAILFYPLALLILALAAGRRLEVLAGAWGMLAFGDAAATLVGRRWGRRGLPWNRAKSWVGSGAFLVAAWSSAVVLVRWAAPGRYELATVLWAATLAALVGALAESLPWALDDNLSVTLLGGAALFAGLEVLPLAGAWGAERPWAALSAVVALALIARLSGALDWAGTLTGALIAVAVVAGAGGAGLAVLGLFVLGGTAAGRWRQARTGTLREPARGAANVLANGSVAAGCGLALAAGAGPWALPALGGALATAMADTVGGEVGQALGGATRRLTDGQAVAPGAEGGVSWAGTLATALAATLLAGLGLGLGLFDLSVAGVVAAAGLAGALIDSLLGASFERRGLLDNEATNCLATLAGAWLAARAAHYLLGPAFGS